MSFVLPQGFRAAGIAAGIKENGNKDLAVIVNDGPNQAAAGVFTTNRVQAAPVKYSKKVITDGVAHAVVLNSGGANACTGELGYADTVATAQRAAEALNIDADDVLVCSTGLIGAMLPMDKLLPGIDTAVEQLSATGGQDAADAIMTTDTVSKTASTAGEGFVVSGITKGAGMIAPGLATMLAVVTTDAQVDAPVLQEILTEAVRVSFNRADSDGCMSTNDTVILMSSGTAPAPTNMDKFQQAVNDVCANLARQIIGDAEGASHDIAVTVTGAVTEQEAEDVARAVTRSNLFKTAVFGKDPNWGRVMSAVGTTDAEFDADQLDVTFNGVMVGRNGGVGDDRNLVKFEGREVRVDIDLKAGDAQATVWTNDLTYDYIRENAEYSS